MKKVKPLLMLFYYFMMNYLNFVICIVFYFADDSFIEYQKFDSCPLSYNTLIHLEKNINDQNMIIDLSQIKMNFQFDPNYHFINMKKIFFELEKKIIYVNLKSYIFKMFIHSKYKEFAANCQIKDFIELINSKIYYFLKKNKNYIKKLLFFMLMKNINLNQIVFEFLESTFLLFPKSEYAQSLKHLYINSEFDKLIEYKQKIHKKLLHLQEIESFPLNTFENNLLNWEESYMYLFDMKKNNFTIAFTNDTNEILFYLCENISHINCSSVAIPLQTFDISNFLKIFENPVFFQTLFGLKSDKHILNILRQFNSEFEIIIDISKIYSEIIQLSIEDANNCNSYFIDYNSQVFFHSHYLVFQVLCYRIFFVKSKFEKIIIDQQNGKFYEKESDLLLNTSMFILKNIYEKNEEFCLTKIANKYIQYVQDQNQNDNIEVQFLNFSKKKGDSNQLRIEIKSCNQILDIQSNSVNMQIDQINSNLDYDLTTKNVQKLYSGYEFDSLKSNIIKSISAVIEDSCSTIKSDIETIPKIETSKCFDNLSTKKTFIYKNQIFSKFFYFFYTRFDILFKENLRITSYNNVLIF